MIILDLFKNSSILGVLIAELIGVGVGTIVGLDGRGEEEEREDRHSPWISHGCLLHAAGPGGRVFEIHPLLYDLANKGPAPTC